MKRMGFLVVACFAVHVLTIPAFAEGVYVKGHLNYYDSPNFQLTKFPVWGGGAEVGGRWGPDSNWGWSLGGGYAIGGAKFEPAAGGEREAKVNSWYARVGVDYHNKVGPADLYCGPGLFYSGSKIEVEQTGLPTQEFESFNFFGIENRVGSGVPIGGGTTQVFGEFSSMFGRGTIDDPTNLGGKESSWNSSMGYRGGLRYTF